MRYRFPGRRQADGRADGPRRRGAEKLLTLCARKEYEKRLSILPGDVIRLKLGLAQNESPMKAAKMLIEAYSKI